MATGVTFGCEDIRYKNVPQVENVVAQLEDVDMEVPEVTVPATPAPRFECASL